MAHECRGADAESSGLAMEGRAASRTPRTLQRDPARCEPSHDGLARLDGQSRHGSGTGSSMYDVGTSGLAPLESDSSQCKDLTAVNEEGQ
jgi:hypothetical protein